MSGDGANALTTGAFDPYSKQPELKHAAVEVDRTDLPHEGGRIASARPRRFGRRSNDCRPCSTAFRLRPCRCSARSTPASCCALEATGPSTPMLLPRSTRATGGENLRTVTYEDPARVHRQTPLDRCGEPHHGRAAMRRHGRSRVAEGADAERRLGSRPPSPCRRPPHRAPRPREPERSSATAFRFSEGEIRAAVSSGADLPAVAAFAQMRNQLRILHPGAAADVRERKLDLHCGLEF